MKCNFFERFPAEYRDIIELVDTPGLSDINSNMFPEMINSIYSSVNVELIMFDLERIEHQEN